MTDSGKRGCHVHGATPPENGRGFLMKKIFQGNFEKTLDSCNVRCYIIDVIKMITTNPKKLTVRRNKK